MSFNARKQCKPKLQNAVGLHKMEVDRVRKGDLTRPGEQAPDMICAYALKTGLNKETAAVLFEALSDDVKDNPTSVAQANAVGRLAIIAGEQPPKGCRRYDGYNVEEEDTTYYWTPGSHLFTGKMDSAKFITFYYKNTTKEDRVDWAELTGAEQFEWVEAWKRCQKEHGKNEQQTRGLRGTDVKKITTVEELDLVAPNTPSLKRRRPANHGITVANWTSPDRAWEGSEDEE